MAAVSLYGVGLLASPPVAIGEGEEEPAEEIVIKGQRANGVEVFTAVPERATPNAPDTASLLRLVPGGDVVNNGALSGQVQYRGLQGDRVHVRVNDMFVQPGGPNWMDPPLHYAPRALVDSLQVDLGIVPVSRGAETLGGSVRANLKKGGFAEGPGFGFGGDLELSGRSADASVVGGGVLALANEGHRFEVIGSAERGGDYDTPEGEVSPSRYERYVYGGGYGAKFGAHEIDLEYRRNDTREAGTPALPMDIRFVETDLANARYSGTLGEVVIEGNVDYIEVDHVMDNFTLRTVAGPQRAAAAKSDGVGWGLRLAHDLVGGEFALGGDGHHAKHDMDISDPGDPVFAIENFNDARRNRYSVFGEWRGNPVGPLDALEAELGLRYTRVSMDTGNVSIMSSMPSPPAMALRDAFNASDRERGENMVDVVLKLGYEIGDHLRLELAGGRKTRAPSYIERYAWLPLEVTGGLADGKNYVGDIALEHEKSHEFEGGFVWRSRSLYVTPRAFYRSIDDYIQGTPSSDPNVIMVSSMLGDPVPLQFSNVEAELYGFDTGYGVRLPWNFQLDGTLSYVRGRRRDIDDDLYRIAPLRGRTTLSYIAEDWTVAVESLYAAGQDQVSLTNEEAPSDAWGVMNLFASWEFREGFVFSAGIDNVTNVVYSDHLAGVARVSSDAVAQGMRLPAQGVSFYAGLSAEF